ncbi:MAG: cupredoxin domain-containing protein [Xanthobacteraceae bacterium]|nr:MAG: cupredoxin domain-containing protein [Xanthobacteraceae bacterium]
MGCSVSKVSLPESARARRAMIIALAAVALLLGASHRAPAEDEPVFRIEFNDGKVVPQRLEVPARRRFKLELHNVGQTPAEFESKELRKEKVLAPNSSSTLVIRTLDPGDYDFFDDFHPDAPPAVLVAK